MDCTGGYLNIPLVLLARDIARFDHDVAWRFEFV